MHDRHGRAAFKIFLWTQLLSSPFWGIFSLLPIILYKDLHSSPLQITLISTLKPLTAICASYYVRPRGRNVLSHLSWAHLLKFVPFLFFPLSGQPWFLISAFAFFMVLLRASLPAWMEVLKVHLSHEQRGRALSYGLMIDYLGAALLPFIFGWFLDNFHQAWRWLFPMTALIGMLPGWLIYRLPFVPLRSTFSQNIEKRKKWREHLTSPWKNCYYLLSVQPHFLHFQVGFFLGGAGLMIMQPALPKYFVDCLHLSYTNLLLAITSFKGVGLVLSSPIWARAFKPTKILALCGVVTFIASSFPLFLTLAQHHFFFLFLAYFAYGVMQGGSELSWKMSGPIFAKDKDSTPYSFVNVLFVGIRGAIFPIIGTYLCSHTPISPMVVGGFFCAAGGLYLWSMQKRMTSHYEEEGRVRC